MALCQLERVKGSLQERKFSERQFTQQIAMKKHGQLLQENGNAREEERVLHSIFDIKWKAFHREQLGIESSID